MTQLAFSFVERIAVPIAWASWAEAGIVQRRTVPAHEVELG